MSNAEGGEFSRSGQAQLSSDYILLSVLHTPFSGGTATMDSSTYADYILYQTYMDTVLNRHILYSATPHPHPNPGKGFPSISQLAAILHPLSIQLTPHSSPSQTATATILPASNLSFFFSSLILKYDIHF